MKEYSEQLAKEICSKIKEIWTKMDNVENWTFKVVASDETVDRVWESIKIDGWDLKNYFKNPIILFGHKYNDMDDVVWKATKVYVENDQLIVEWIFAGTNSWQQLRQLYEEWILKTVSVWFIVKERDTNNTKIITKAELLELSFVPVPCNPNALSLSKDVLDACIENGMIKEIDENDDTSCMEQDTIDEINSIENNDESENQNEPETENQESVENDEEKTIKEMEEVNIEKDIYLQLMDQLKTKYQEIRVLEIYTKHFIFYADGSYYDQAWKIKWENAVIDGEPKRVEPKTVWIEKTIQKSNRELLEEIKSWMSNDKDDAVDQDDMEAKMKMQKEALQNVSKVVSDVLHKIKL